MPKKIKLCVIVPAHWEAFMGGAQYQVKCLIDRASSSQQFDIYYLARKINFAYQPSHHKVIQIKGPSNLRKYGYFFDSYQLLSLLKKINPDVIYQRVACGYTGIAAYYAKNSNCKMIWHIAHDQDVMSFNNKLSLNVLFRYTEKKFIKYAIKNADSIIAQTKSQSDLLFKNFNKKPTVIIPNFHPESKNTINKKEPIKILWVANYKPVKQPEVFVKLANDLRHVPNTKFIMIGSQDVTNKSYIELKKNMDQLVNLEYLGGKTQDEVNELLASSHIFVNTSTHEGFANTFIQAWMRCVPVVSLNVNPDKIFNIENIGYFSGSYNKLREDVETLITNNKLREKLGKNAQEYAFKNHSMINADKLLKLLST